MTDFSTLTVDDNCDTLMIDNRRVREIPIRLLEPGERFQLVLSTGRRYPGTLIRKGPGTVAVVLDHAEKERSFTTREGQEIRLVQSGGVQYWSPGSPVVRLDEDRRDVTRWTTKGGTGVGPNPERQDEEETSAMTERTAGLPLGGAAKTKTDKKKAGKAAKAKVAKAPKTLNDCLDGCGEKVTGRFRQGHDARYYSMLKKVKAGEMTFNQLPRLMQQMLKDKQGALRALAASKH